MRAETLDPNCEQATVADLVGFSRLVNANIALVGAIKSLKVFDRWHCTLYVRNV